MATGDASITAARVSFARRSSCSNRARLVASVAAASRATISSWWRPSSDAAMVLNMLASAPTSSRVQTVVRWLRSPAASAEASVLNCRKGLMI